MKTDTALNIADLEMLAQAYLDCRLSRREEKELALVLAVSEADSPLLAEARETMGIEMRMAESGNTGGALLVRAGRRHRRAWRLGAAAACVALLAGAAWMQLRPAEPDVIVVIGGRELSGSAARAEASRMEAEDMRMMRELMADAERQQAENIALLNELI